MANVSKYGFIDHGSKHVAVVKANAEQETKIYDELVKSRLSKETAMHEERIKMMEATRKAIADAEGKGMKADATRLRRKLGQFKRFETEYQEELLKLRDEAIKKAILFEQNQYQHLSVHKKLEASKSVVEELKSRREAIQAQYSLELEEFKTLVSQKESLTEQEQQRLNILSTQLKDVQTELDDIDKLLPVAEHTFNVLFDKFATASDKAKKAADDYTAAEQRRQEALVAAESALSEYNDVLKDTSATEEQKKEAKKLADARQEEADAANKAAQAALDHKQSMEEEAKKYKTLEDAQKEEEDAAKKRGKKLSDTYAKAAAAAENAVSSNLQAIYGKQGEMEGRLQGSGVSWKENLANINSIVNFSGAVSQKKVIEKMAELVDSGVAYNLELRAFLAETSENIASTFDAANGTLLRMIRLQQSDTTAARLGMEAMLTKLFNSYFQDTSYLTNNGPADSVAAAILDVSATLPKNDSLAFEFTVQKWLGSLYSLGMSEQAVGTIAEGLNYLGTGNVSALNSNSALQTLFAMSASRAGGKSYSQMLTTGLNNEDTNKLLKAMIEYLAEIADSQTNYVTKAAYADLFGMSITDLSAFSSLTPSEIQKLYSQTASYGSLMSETKGQLGKIPSRLHFTQLIDTAMENAEVGVAREMSSNLLTYGTWKALSVLKDYVGEVEIPGITAAGFGIASGLDVLNIAQTAMAGMGLIQSLIKGLGSMTSGGPLSFGNWDYNQYTSRGGGLSILDTGIMQTTSASSSIGVGGATGEEMTEVSVETAREQAMESEGITAEEFEEQKEIPQSILDAIGEEEGVTVISLLQEMTDALAGDSEKTVLNLLQEIDDRLDPGRVFYTAIAGIISSSAVSDITNLSSQLSAAKATANLATESVIENSAGSSATKVNATTTNAVTGSPESISDFESGSGSLNGTPSELSLEERIAAAVVSGLREYGFSNQLPVQISNLGVIG